MQQVQQPIDYPYGYPPPPQYPQPQYQQQYPPYNTGADNFARSVKWGLIGVGGVAAIGITAYWLYQRHISYNEQLKALDKGDPASFATKLHMAFENNGWPGADTAVVRQVFRDIPDQDTYDEVEKSYKKSYGVGLSEELQEYLKTSELEEMDAIKNSKPKRKGKNDPAVIYDPYAWAKRLRAGVTYEWGGWGWGTDLDAVKLAIKEIPTQRAWEDVKAAYAEDYPGEDLEADLEDDIDSDDYDWKAAIKKKPYA